MDALENTHEIEKLLKEIDNDQDELNQFISMEEEQINKQVTSKINLAEQEIQNSRRDMNLGIDSFRQMTQNNFADHEPNQTQRIGAYNDNYMHNQHHNSISNNSGSFYFNISKKI